ncbi:glycoside hydrolase family 127 protein [Streptomyces radicis]|uniref:Glycoside hydrolase family 127 protein n=1 Tax=Streptomyces radicis TaxID=1750517 RepID=A0A3A9VRH6_9ACTN|nr:beta-L-arabinofuranosidase domain-containing protein [Streptomyces radicis]RKN03152.1 glycoside hydrolase family 127 protein [Streptomyces radicis]RKN13069.1 glycoside hydrolase family 127 protein [Streptomyces radicis]
MTASTGQLSGPLLPTDSSATTLRPVAAARVTGGFWHARRSVNAATSVPAGHQRLIEAGNLHNLRLAAGTATGKYVNTLPFLDSDVYKWLEAVAWQLGDPGTGAAESAELAGLFAEVTELLADAQEPSGYLDSFYQVVRPDRRWQELEWGHELYCAGHLIQAAVAHTRATGRTELLAIARKFADHIDAVFGTGEGRVDGVCGHPEIETALVELFRVTGERRYLELARYFVDRRGHGLVPEGRFGSRYWQDHVPVREADAVAGHAVRQLYLLAGVVDVYAETGDASLLAAAERCWEEMAAEKTYLTGGLGSRHTDEAFGDPYELPSERAYTETCAAIASAMLSWRLLLATGKARYADHLERVLFNGFLAGVALDGEHYSYVNPLHVRDGYVPWGGDRGAFRTRWFHCACCPPNVMRLLSSLPHYLTASDGEGLVVHQYATGSYAAEGLAVEVATDYPWRGRIEVTVTGSPDADRTLTLRVPHWAAGRWTANAAGERVGADAESEGWLRIRRRWRTGDTVVLDLDLAPRLTAPPSRADALRGCLAIERGPLVYCTELADHPAGTALDDLRIDPAVPLRETAEPGLLDGVVTVTGAAVTPPPVLGLDWWPYGPASGERDQAERAGAAREFTAIPYHLWGHREQGAMRVWLPVIGSDPALADPGGPAAPNGSVR